MTANDFIFISWNIILDIIAGQNILDKPTYKDKQQTQLYRCDSQNNDAYTYLYIYKKLNNSSV